MALRARLAAPPPQPPTDWPFHEAKSSSVSSHLFWRGDRRMEAENYLSSGYGLKLAIEARAVGWQRLGSLATIIHPNRTKGILVSSEDGVPWLAPTQVFESRPSPRKWLAKDKITDANNLFVVPGTILVTRSGNVGRALIATNLLNGALISDDMLRLPSARNTSLGWLYAYLRSPQARAMMTGAQYGHIIKHLEISHLSALPVPVVQSRIADDFQKQTEAILELRNRAHQLTLDAEALFAKAIGPLEVKDWGEAGFSVKGSLLFSGRRRLEGIPWNPGATKIKKHLSKHGNGFSTFFEAGFDVWLPTRFKRIPADDGVPMLDSSDLFEVNPDVTKRIAERDFGDPHKGRVKAGWLLLARSGQTYGLNGSLVLATAAQEGMVVSDHVVRIAPRKDTDLRLGYALVALSHPSFGRPLVKSLAYGSSIPEIDPTDFGNHPIVRLTPSLENAIADLAEESAALRAKADVLEREMAAEAGRLIDRFLAGDVVNFVVTMPAVESPTLSAPPPEAIPEHALVRLRKTRKADGVKAGSEGTVVHVYSGGVAYEVEFPTPKGAPLLLTLKPGEIEEVL